MQRHDARDLQIPPTDLPWLADTLADQIRPNDAPRPDGPRQQDIWPADVHQPDDLKFPPDGQPACDDTHEPNNQCSQTAPLSLVDEGYGWSKTYSGTLNPAADTDWYLAKAAEVWHFCFPPDPQCYRFKAQLDVPTGRQLKICLRLYSCSAVPSCNSSSIAGPQSLTVELLIDGECGITDDIEVLISVEPLDSTGGCAPYDLKYRYDQC